MLQSFARWMRPGWPNAFETSERWPRRSLSAERTHDGGRILFRNSDGAADRIDELFALEKECCSFFDFSVELVDDTIRVTVKAPEQAAAFVNALLENFSKPTARPASAADPQSGDRS